MTANIPLLIVAATGLKAEARLVARTEGVRAVAGGGDGALLVAGIERAIAEGARAVLSVGIAGGLDPGLVAGDVIVAQSVIAGNERFETDGGWRQRLAAALPGAHLGVVAASEAPLATRAAKAQLYAASGALAVDMESHVAARVAALHKLPLAVIRVVGDGAHRTLPPAALAGMAPGGAINFAGVFKSLARQPSQIAELLRVSADTNTAMASLLRSLRALGPGICLDLGAGLGGADLR